MTKNDEQWVKFGRTAPKYVWSYFWFAAGMWVPSILGLAFAAETLPAVSPPTDWTGVGVAIGIAVVVVGVIAYIQYLRRPGSQIGEETIERIVKRTPSGYLPPRAVPPRPASPSVTTPPNLPGWPLQEPLPNVPQPDPIGRPIPPNVAPSFAKSTHAKESAMDKQILITVDEAGNLKSAVQLGANPPPPPVEDWRNETGWPKLKVINNVRYNLLAPLNPNYKGAASDFSIGGANNPDSYIGDPAGAAGLRSPAGYPLAGGKVLYEGNALEDDAAVEEWIARTSGHDAAAADWSALDKLKGTGDGGAMTIAKGAP